MQRLDLSVGCSTAVFCLLLTTIYASVLFAHLIPYIACKMQVMEEATDI